MTEPILLTAEQVDADLLNSFLRRMYSPLKSQHQIEYGKWLHHSDKNRLVIQVMGQIAGYCAVIPAKVWIAGYVHTALWWVDLVIAPKFRGLGLQTIFDQKTREMSSLLLGFPNSLAAKIHKKHLWGVRDDMQILMLPLNPLQSKSVRGTQGKRGYILRLGALGLSPLAAIWRAKLSKTKTNDVKRIKKMNASILSDVFTQTKAQGINTTWRDENYFQWRYGAAPHPTEYNYYIAGKTSTPSHYLISRHIKQQDGVRYTRILDIFGDFNDSAALEDLLRLAIQDAISYGSGQVTILASRPQLQSIARRLGFFLSAPINFCWTSLLPQVMTALGQENYWTLADSDNDAPD
jgi:hypothetical protein